ncbi:MAG: ComEC/Rec2 family competence protein [Verrucomicrobiaceae bacterium]|nr:ComEC/Rec2 family competence protein [Verrucomicrobiaceae bacterium]
MDWREVKSLTGKHPLLLVALAALAGILIGEGQYDLVWPMGITGALFLVLAAAKGTMWGLIVGTFCSFTAIHAMRWAECFSHPLVGMQAPGEPIVATAVGRFVSAPVVEEMEERREILFEATEIRFAGRSKGLKGQSLISLSGRLVSGNFVAHGGDYVVTGRLYSPSQPLNPTLYDRRTASLRQGIVGAMSVTELHEVGPREPSIRLWLLSVAESSREWIGRALARGIEDDDDAVKLIRTMALGTAEKDTEQMAEPFRQSGTLHVFAVSGLHVGLIGVIGWLALKMCRVGRRNALMLLIPLVFFYAFITGWRASAARAAFMTAVMVLAPLFNRHGRICNALGLAALLLWASDTQQTFEAGFQLSFLVLMAIAVGSHLLARPFLPWARLDDFLPLPVATWWQRTQAWMKESIVMLLATSMAAWVGSTPLMIGHFRSLTSIALLANVFLVPLSFVSLACVALSLMAAVLGLGGVQQKLNNANLLVAHTMTYSAEAFSAVPGGNTPLGQKPPTKVDPPQLVIPSLPPGQGGQLMVVDGEGWWLDCGGKRSYDNAIRSLIQATGVRDFKGIIFSHSDAEHVGAAYRLFKRYPMSMIKLPVFEPWQHETSKSLLQELSEEKWWKDKTIQKLQAGERVPMGSDVVMDILHPSGLDLHDQADDRCLVARIHLNGHRLLWVSDAGFVVEKELLERYQSRDLEAEILLRGQHATDYSALPEFLMAVSPKMVVTAHYPSVEGGAAPAHLIEYCQKNGVHLVDLQQDGMTTINFALDAMTVKTHRSERALRLTP